MKYQFFAPLSPEARQSLKESIAREGVLEPIVRDQHGNLIDGHHRLEICQELGIPCPERVHVCETEEDGVTAAYALNLFRRQLDDMAWAKAFKEYLNIRGVKRGRGANQQTHSADIAESPTVTFAQACQELGVSERTARDRLAKADAFESLPEDRQQAVRTGESTLAKETKVKKKKAERSADTHPQKAGGPPLEEAGAKPPFTLALELTSEELATLLTFAGDKELGPWARETLLSAKPVVKQSTDPLAALDRPTQPRPPSGLCPRCSRIGKPSCDTCIKRHGRILRMA